MISKIIELHDKEVINLKDGFRMGYVNDVEFDTVTGTIISLIVYGKAKLFGILGRENDLIIPWEDIEVIGDDTILVNTEPYFPPQKKKIHSVAKFIWE